MRAAVHDGYGDADVIRIDQVPVPTIADDEVLVRVEAAGVDRGTWHLLTGQPYLARLAIGLRRPRVTVLGRDVAGTVVATGAEEHRFAVGDSVFGVATGSFAEYAKAKERKLCADDPTGFPLWRRRSSGISGMTALQAIDAADVKAAFDSARNRRIRRRWQLRRPDRTWPGSTRDRRLACRQGRLRSVARRRTSDRLRPSPDGDDDGPYDAIIDTGGDTSLSRLRSMLAPRGTLVIVGGEGGDPVTGMGRQLHARILSPFVGQRLTFIVNRERQADLERLRALVEDGIVKPAVDTVYPLEQAAEAVRHLVAGRTQGKLAVAVNEPPRPEL